MDRNEFFSALCDVVNRCDRLSGRTWARDLSEPNWRRDLADDYDVVVAVNAEHWLSLARAAELQGRSLPVSVSTGIAHPSESPRINWMQH